VQASLVEMHAEPDRVTLQWFVRDASVAAITVERRRGTEPWTPLGTPERVGTDRLAFEDRDVIAGEEHRYRLAVRQGGGVDHTDEIAVEVPSAHRLWLAGAWPNPSDGERMQVAFSLSRRSAGRLELFDIGGRQVAHRDLGSLPPGAHRVTFGDARLEPGVYVIRLAAEGRTLTAKALVVR
jgi:hypothetical protein